jgi:zinc transporter ZupT
MTRQAVACVTAAIASSAVIVAFLVALGIAIQNEPAETAAFNSITNNFTNVMYSTLNYTILELAVVASLFSVVPVVNNTMFLQFVSNLPNANLNNLSWAELIPKQNVMQFEDSVRSEVSYFVVFVC